MNNRLSLVISGFLFVLYAALAVDVYRMHRMLADYDGPDGVKAQALCAHATIVNEGRHPK